MTIKALWALVALSILQVILICASNNVDLCTSSKRKLATQMCHKYSCRNKCNSTVDRDSESHGACRCDKECVVYNDCCYDFSASCPERSQQAMNRYPSTVMDCVGNISVVGGIMDHSLFPSTMATLLLAQYKDQELENSNNNFFNPNKPGISPWLITLVTGSHIKVEKHYGLLLYDWVFLPEVGFGNQRYSYDKFNAIRVVLNVVKRFPVIASLEESDTTTIQSLGFLEEPGIQMRHECFVHEKFICAGCGMLLNVRQFCFTEGRDFIREEDSDGGDALDNEEMAAGSSCSVFSSASLDQAMTLAEVTVTPDNGANVTPDNENISSTFASDELPWSKFQCGCLREHCGCRVHSCGQGRILSPDKRACFVPSRISVLVVRRNQDMTAGRGKRSSSLFVPNEHSLKTFSESPMSLFSSQSDGVAAEEERGRLGTGDNRVPAPFGLCVALYQLLQRHTEWTVLGISLRQNCHYGFKFKSFSVLTKRRKQEDGNQMKVRSRIKDNSHVDDEPSGRNVTDGNEQTGRLENNVIQKKKVLRPPVQGLLSSIKGNVPNLDPTNLNDDTGIMTGNVPNLDPTNLNDDTGIMTGNVPNLDPANLKDDTGIMTGNVPNLDPTNLNDDTGIMTENVPNLDPTNFNDDTGIMIGNALHLDLANLNEDTVILKGNTRDLDLLNRNDGTDIMTDLLENSAQINNRSGPIGTGEDGIQQAWSLILESLSDLPNVDQFLKMELCLGTGPAAKCVQDKGKEMCEDVMSVCHAYELPWSNVGINKAYSTVSLLPMIGRAWILLVVIMMIV